jgi:hemerythrin-like metal-binding protein
MRELEWNEEFSIGLGELDQQHEELFRLLNDIIVRSRTAEHREQILAALDSLISATTDHFSAEERMMREAGFPFMIRHAEEHNALTALVLRFRSQFADTGVQMDDYLLTFLCHWLVDHIRIMDREYGRFMSSTRHQGGAMSPTTQTNGGAV